MHLSKQQHKYHAALVSKDTLMDWLLLLPAMNLSIRCMSAWHGSGLPGCRVAGALLIIFFVAFGFCRHFSQHSSFPAITYRHFAPISLPAISLNFSSAHFEPFRFISRHFAHFLFPPFDGVFVILTFLFCAGYLHRN